MVFDTNSISVIQLEFAMKLTWGRGVCVSDQCRRKCIFMHGGALNISVD